MTDLPLDARGRRPAFFDKDGVDQLLSMMLELATEVWVVRERLYRVEAAAEAEGMPLRTLAETRRTDPRTGGGTGRDARAHDRDPVPRAQTGRAGRDAV